MTRVVEADERRLDVEYEDQLAACVAGCSRAFGAAATRMPAASVNAVLQLMEFWTEHGINLSTGVDVARDVVRPPGNVFIPAR